MSWTYGRPIMDVSDYAGAYPRAKRAIQPYANWYFVQAGIFILLGVSAVLVPRITVVSLDLLLGSLFVLSGVFQMVASLQSRMHWWSSIASLLSIMAGGFMLWAPLVGVIAIVMAISVFLAAKGFTEVMLAVEMRPARHWNWMLASGLTAMMLSLVLWIGFPSLGVYLLSTIIAINFIFYGVSLLALGASARPAAKRSSFGR